ncbi:MAG: MBL fold metallo-hydrolase [Arcobacteraceae bacterium]|nr:MBL fold metallo-hydrolase [Arcobacteraceae bacterium]
MNDSTFTKKVLIYALDAGNGDCILIHQIDTNKKILIDSGPSKGKGRINVQNALREILAEDNLIDLAILTHNDDDHIGGYKSLIENKIIIITKFIFNNSDYIKDIFSTSDKKYSYKQDIKLQDLLNNKDIELLNFYNENNTKKLTDFIFNDFKFNFLSPNKSKLDCLHKWINKKDKEENKKQIQKFSSPLDKNNICKEFDDILNKLKLNDIFEEDTGAPNGSSLAFSLSIGSCNFLFLGDAHSSLIEQEIPKLKNKKFDLCKLSHHGSKKNTSKSLLKTFTCNDYLICSDGCNNHAHPSLYSIGRIFLNNNNANFHFTSNTKEVLKFKEITQIKSKFPENKYLRFEYEY